MAQTTNSQSWTPGKSRDTIASCISAEETTDGGRECGLAQGEEVWGEVKYLVGKEAHEVCGPSESILYLSHLALFFSIFYIFN